MACLSHFRKNLWPFALIILAVGATVYYRVFHFQFLPLWDDAGHVLNVYEIRFLNWQNLIKIFSTSYVGMYQPITTLTYALDYQIWGLSSSGFHLHVTRPRNGHAICSRKESPECRSANLA